MTFPARPPMVRSPGWGNAEASAAAEPGATDSCVALGPPPLVTVSVMPTAAAMTTAAVPVQAAQMRRRLRRASRALIWAVFFPACRLFWLPLAISTGLSTSLSPEEDRLQFTCWPSTLKRCTGGSRTLVTGGRRRLDPGTAQRPLVRLNDRQPPCRDHVVPG